MSWFNSLRSRTKNLAIDENEEDEGDKFFASDEEEIADLIKDLY